MTFFLMFYFLNPNNVGDFAVVEIKNNDFKIMKEKIPNDIKEELERNLAKILSKNRDKLEKITIKDYDTVELIIEDERYLKFGVHKGDRGCVVDSKAVQNYIEVDFSRVNNNGEFTGDCISVDIKDIKVVKN